MGRKVKWVVALVALALPAGAANSPGIISGHVNNAAGIAQMGAVVEIASYKAAQAVTVFTDGKGYYSASGLPPGNYDVKVTAPSFLPTVKENVPVKSGANVVVDLTLNTLADAIKWLPPKRGSQEDDDWKWTLRSAANRPILRMKNGQPTVVASETSGGKPLKAAVAFMAGAPAEGFGNSGEMSTNFSLERSLFASGHLSFKGDVGYGYGSGPSATVLHTAYSQILPDGSQPEFSLTLRRFAVSPNTAVHDGALEALTASAAHTVTLGEVLDIRAGSEFQAIQFVGRVNAFKPFGSAVLHMGPDTVLQYQYVTAVPNSRHLKGFESAPADLSESGPRMSLANAAPVLERARHQEVSVSRRRGRDSVQLAFYADRIANAALTGVGDLDALSDDVLPEVYSGTFTYSGGTLNTNGLRLVVEHKLKDDLAATLDYSYGGVLALAEADPEFDGTAPSLHNGRRHAVAGKITGTAPHLGTHWLASYKWTSGSALLPVDLFNMSAGQADPYLNVFVRQPIPGTGFIPAKVEALVDLRNLLAQGYVPVLGRDGRTIYLVQSARSVRGGLAFVF